MDEGFKGMYVSLDRARTNYTNIIEFVESNGLDDMFEDMYGRRIREYIEIFGLEYHDGDISREIILGLCEGGISEPRRVKVLPDHSLEIRW